jgi:acyl dehydratase
MTTQELVGLPQVGAEAEPWTFGPITQTDIVRYAGASGDFNPIHHDDQYAKSAGFPGVFSIGMLQAGCLATFAAEWFGEENVRRFQVRFKDMVWPGDTCTCRGRVTSVTEMPEGGHAVSVALECVRQNDDVVLTGSADFLLP